MVSAELLTLWSVMDAKQQHYVPQFYLEGFADPAQPNSIWVYDRDTGDLRLQGIRNTAVEGHYYSLAGCGKSHDFTVRDRIG